jgi:hypothetical protein
MSASASRVMPMAAVCPSNADSSRWNADGGL